MRTSQAKRNSVASLAQSMLSEKTAGDHIDESDHRHQAEADGDAGLFNIVDDRAESGDLLLHYSPLGTSTITAKSSREKPATGAIARLPPG